MLNNNKSYVNGTAYQLARCTLHNKRHVGDPWADATPCGGQQHVTRTLDVLHCIVTCMGVHLVYS